MGCLLFRTDLQYCSTVYYKVFVTMLCKDITCKICHIYDLSAVTLTVTLSVVGTHA